MIRSHFETLAGYPVHEWRSGEPLPPGTIPSIGLEYEDYEEGQKWIDKFTLFLENEPSLEALPGLIVGPYDFESSENSGPIVEALVASSQRFPNLKALFIGDILSEELEISWIEQSDVSPLFGAFPQLEYFGVRGGNNLNIGSPRHEKLKSFVVQAGGLDARIVQSLTKAQLPELEHLELYLGTDNYGATTTIEDLEPLLSGALFPKLRYLGLRDSEIADAIALAVAKAPILQRLEVLDLSLGTLGDEGAQALLDSEAVRNLKKLDVHYHFCTDAMQEKLKALPIEVDASEAQSGDEWDGEIHRYVSVSE
jgi:hypothetical protein